MKELIAGIIVGIIGILSIYLTICALSIFIKTNDMSATDWRWYCVGKHYARIDYIFPTWKIACWLSEEIDVLPNK